MGPLGNMVSAHIILEDVPLAGVFWTCNGVVLHNLSELKNYLEGCSDYDFRYHVNEDHYKNDFATWVREVIKDATLARDLDSITNKEGYLRTITKRLKALAT
jgi:hypothetical protein